MLLCRNKALTLSRKGVYMIFESEYLSDSDSVFGVLHFAFNGPTDWAMEKWVLSTCYEFDADIMRQQDAYFELVGYIDTSLLLNLHPESEC